MIGGSMTLRARRDAILDRLQRSGEVRFGDLASEFGVSEMTIRRDIDALESGGVVRRIVGGAITSPRKSVEPPFASRLTEETTSKRLIAGAVVDLLGDAETVILDSGSTALTVARELVSRPLANMTIITPSVPAAAEIAGIDGITVLLPGGELRNSELSLIGPETVSAIQRYNCDTFIMGVAGVDADRGISDYHRDESEVKRVAMQRADRVIVAADRTKLGRSALASIAPIASVDALVTDAAPDHPTVQAIRALGIEVVCVSATDATEAGAK